MKILFRVKLKIYTLEFIILFKSLQNFVFITVNTKVTLKKLIKLTQSTRFL